MTTIHQSARRTLCAVAVLICALTPTLSGFTACQTGSGVAKTKRHDRLGTFTHISLNYPARFLIKRGDPTSVVVTADDNVVGKLPLRVLNDTLYVGGKEDISSKTPVDIVITTPRLEGLHSTRALRVEVEGLRGGELEVSVQVPDEWSTRKDTHPRFILHGALEQLNVRTQGKVWIDAIKTTAQRVRAEVIGEGTVDVRAVQRLDASVSGGPGRVRFVAKPAKLSQQIGSGAGEEATIGLLDMKTRDAELDEYLGKTSVLKTGTTTEERKSAVDAAIGD